MVQQLGHEFDFKIITSDRDLGDKRPYPSLCSNQWVHCGLAQVYYIDTASFSKLGILSVIRSIKFDVLYLNSFFSFQFSILPSFARKIGLIKAPQVVIAPRGEFSTGALKIKIFKKLPYITVVKLLSVYDDFLWHASTKFELDDIYNLFSKRKIDAKIAQVACDLPEPCLAIEPCAEVLKNEALQSISLRVCFLSRISPMKNLDYAISVLSKVSAQVDFCIYGPKESSEYWAVCKRLLQNLPKNIMWRYGGALANDEVKNILAHFDLFFVPTRGENFGHVFQEALSAGVPILVSDQTPWRDLHQKNIGWDIPLDQPERFVEVINNHSKSDINKRTAMRVACKKFALENANNVVVLEANRSLFNR